MDVMLETPSRVWRRIKDNEARNDDLPSLPSLSMDQDRDDHTASISFHRPMLPGLKKGFSSSEEEDESQVYVDASDLSQQRPDPTPKARPAINQQRFTPVQSTPLASSDGRTVRRPTPGSTGSRVRFATAIETRSYANESHEHESFDASRISYVSANGVGRQGRLDEADLNNSGAYDRSQNSVETNPAVYEDEDELEEVSIVQEVVPSPPAKQSPNTSVRRCSDLDQDPH